MIPNCPYILFDISSSSSNSVNHERNKTCYESRLVDKYHNYISVLIWQLSLVQFLSRSYFINCDIHRFFLILLNICPSSSVASNYPCSIFLRKFFFKYNQLSVTCLYWKTEKSRKHGLKEITSNWLHQVKKEGGDVFVC